VLWFLVFVLVLALGALLFAPDSRDTRERPRSSWAPLTAASLSGWA
jgi:hypothetical protein